MNKNTLLLSLVIIAFLVVVLKFTILKKSSKELELTYKISAGIPFKWEFEIGDTDIIELVDQYVVKNENKGAITGAPIYTKYVFRGKRKGETTITFKFVSITNDEFNGKEEVHHVIVDENNKIFLVNDD